MKRYPFTCLNDSPIMIHREAWQVIDELETEHEAEILRADEEFRTLCTNALQKIVPGFLGTAVEGAMRKVHCIEYIKNVGPDRRYTAVVNWLLRTVEFIEG